MKILGVIIAGGTASRLGGGTKAFLDVGGKSVVERIDEVLRGYADEVIVNANAGHDVFAAAGHQVISDHITGVPTPLAGLHRALMHARDNGFDAALTAPSDTPFLPLDLGKQLRREWEGRAAVAASGEHIHYIAGLWDARLFETLDRVITQDGMFRVKDWVAFVGAGIAMWPEKPYDPFFNINTPGDLAEARRIAEEFGL